MTEKYDKYAYEPFALTADICIFTIRDGDFSVLLVQRKDDPFKDKWALPGGFNQPDETNEQAALRELFEETGLDANSNEKLHLEQLKTYYKPNRDPRMCVASVAYVAFAPDIPDPVAGDDASDAKWFLVEDALAQNLAFDHNEILADAVERVRSKLEYTTLATSFLPDRFLKSHLYNVYVSVWGAEAVPEKRNFYRKIGHIKGLVEPVKDSDSSYFTAGTAQRITPPLMRKDPSVRDEEDDM